MKSIMKAIKQRIRPVEFFPSVKSQPGVHRALRMLWLEGVFLTISQGFYTEYVSLLILDAGGLVRHIAQLASLNNLASLVAQIPGARLSESRGKPKLIALLATRAIVPIVLVLLILTTVFLRGPSAVYCICAISVLGALSTAFGSPAYTSLLGDLIPMRIRGRYLSSRQLFMTVCGLLAAPIAGHVIQTGGFPSGYQISMGLALIAGVAATLSYGRIPEPTVASQRGKPAHGVTGWKDLLRERRFIRYCLTALIWGIGCQIAAPFFSAHMVENLGFSKTTIGLLRMVTMLATLAGTRVLGQRIDRRGARWAMIVSGLLVPFIPWSWLVVRLPWHAALSNVLSGFAWGGYNLAALHLLLGIVSEPRRARSIAVFNVVNALAAILGPMVGGVLYASYGFRSNLIVSGAGRLMGILAFILLVREWKGDRTGAGASRAV